ncbi:hypothetical protein [Streptomyces sp. NPDC002690]
MRSRRPWAAARAAADAHLERQRCTTRAPADTGTLDRRLVLVTGLFHHLPGNAALVDMCESYDFKLNG